MDHTADPVLNDTNPTSSDDPQQRAHPDTDTSLTSPSDNSTKSPDAAPAGDEGHTGAGTEFKSHMKGTAAPGSHSALFGLQAGDRGIHAPRDPPGGGPGSAALGASGHKAPDSRRQEEDGSGLAGDRTEGKPSLMSKLNPSTDADGDGKKGTAD